MRSLIFAIILYVHATSVTGSITKRRLCLSYRLISSRGDYNILNKSVVHTENNCMTECVRHVDCWAFNFFHNGTCELLPMIGDCEEPRLKNGSIFAHLTTCKRLIPMNLLPRNWSLDECLKWIPYNKDSPCPTDAVISPSGICMTLSFSHGLYMPGWFAEPNGFRFATEKQRALRCPNGYVAQLVDGCSSTWQNYIVGDPIPPNAVQVSVWRDGTPLYSIGWFLAGRRGNNFMGYYLPTTQTVYIVRGIVHNPTNVKIMVLNWSV